MNKIPIQTDNYSYINVGNTTIVTGTFVTPGGSQDVVDTQVVTFPVQFKTTPVVFCTARSAAPYILARNVTVSNRTVTGFTAYSLREDSNTERINYFAIGEKADEN